MKLEEALIKIEELTKENKKLQNRIDFLEEILYTETMEDYNENSYDDYDPMFD